MSLKDRYIRASEKFGGPWSFKTSGVKQSTATSIMDGSIPSADKVYAVAKALGVSLKWLIAGEGEMDEGLAAEAPAHYGKEDERRSREEVVALLMLKSVPKKEVTKWLRTGLAFIESPEAKEILEKRIVALEMIHKAEREKKRPDGKKK